jgi:HK97 gp10 family phage protein
MAEIRSGAIRVRVEGLERLQRQFNKLGEKFPKKSLTKAAKLGSDPIIKDVKAAAPVSKKESKGTLKKSIYRKMEKGKRRTKSVYRIWFNPKYASIFKGKQIVHVGLYGGTRDYGYYPMSVEYGFLGPKGHQEGKNAHFVSKALDKNKNSSLQIVINTLNKEIDKLVR